MCVLFDGSVKYLFLPGKILSAWILWVNCCIYLRILYVPCLFANFSASKDPSYTNIHNSFEDRKMRILMLHIYAKRYIFINLSLIFLWATLAYINKLLLLSRLLNYFRIILGHYIIRYCCFKVKTLYRITNNIILTNII